MHIRVWLVRESTGTVKNSLKPVSSFAAHHAKSGAWLCVRDCEGWSAGARGVGVLQQPDVFPDFCGVRVACHATNLVQGVRRDQPRTRGRWPRRLKTETRWKPGPDERFPERRKFLIRLVARGGIEPPTRGFS